MERREFLKAAAGVSLLAVNPLSACTGAGRNQGTQRPEKYGRAEKVSLAGLSPGAAEKEIDTAMRHAIEGTTDFSWLSRGDTVFIKTVNNSGNPYPATTSPVAVIAMIRFLKEKGAGRIIVGDMSGVQFVRFTSSSLKGSSRKLMEQSGMAAAVASAGAELHCFEEAGWDSFYEDAPSLGTNWKGPIMMPNILKEVDHIVLMPRCSRHILAGSTLGLKAAVGYWRHDTRLEYHHDAATLHEKTAEANTVETLVKKQRLVITLADKILTTLGPDTGHVFEPSTGLVIASQSVLAHELVSLAWLLENRALTPEEERDDFRDTSRAAARIVNNVVVSFLAGWGKAITSESFDKNDLQAVWDDRVLCRACAIAGGAPRTELAAVDKNVSHDLVSRLKRSIVL